MMLGVRATAGVGATGVCGARTTGIGAAGVCNVRRGIGGGPFGAVIPGAVVFAAAAGPDSSFVMRPSGAAGGGGGTVLPTWSLSPVRVALYEVSGLFAGT